MVITWQRAVRKIKAQPHGSFMTKNKFMAGLEIRDGISQLQANLRPSSGDEPLDQVQRGKAGESWPQNFSQCILSQNNQGNFEMEVSGKV